jgi:hypothetical protein
VAAVRLRLGADRLSTWSSTWSRGETVYRTRAEARRAQQKLESEAGSERRLFTIKDNLDRIVL